MKGFLCERRGDAEGAQRAWKEGLYPAYLARLSPELRARMTPTPTGIHVMYYAIMASLSGELSDAEAHVILQKLLEATGETVVGKLAGTVNVQPAVLREMWRTPRGRKIARQVVFLDVTPQESIRLPLYLFATEKFKHDSTGQTATAEQEDLFWQAAIAYGDAALEGKLSVLQIGQLGAAYKGTTNFLGWSGVAPTLEPPMRALAAYGLGLRYIALKRPEDAAMFFRTAIADAPADSPLKRLAQESLDGLTKK
jgi:hypothetical protein